MCGLAGIIGVNSDEKLLDRMLFSQQHRGPDYTGKWTRENVSIGHNRLSIIDLSENANQPFENESYVLVFNGEIYNYLELKTELNHYDFRTNSDTEVLLAAYIYWGKECLNKLNGMFSFAVWDKKKEELFAARDRFGVKPFYYGVKENTLYFSSEIKAIHATGFNKLPDKKKWANYFVYGSYGLPDETFWKDINQLPAGCYFNFRKDKVSIKRWYYFEKEVEKYKNHTKTYLEVKNEYKNLLLESIRLRFRADVPIGFNLSGGLDSSALLALVNKIDKGKLIKAYTFYTNDERYDELPWVKEMINITSNPLCKVLLESDENLSLKIQLITKAQDEPFGGIPTVAYSEIFRKARENKTIVLLDGQGMDEQLAGYDYYTQNNQNTIQGISKSPFRPNILNKELYKIAEKPNYPKHFKNDVLDKQYRDLFFTKIPRALRFNDRISMLYHTELREPFLDYKLVEYAFSLPLAYKINNGVQKSLLRDIVSEILSDNISYAPKRPLQTPQREWLGNQLKSLVINEIDKLKSSQYSTWFNFSEIEKEWNNYLNGDNDSSFHIWQILNFSLLLNN